MTLFLEVISGPVLLLVVVLLGDLLSHRRRRVRWLRRTIGRLGE